VGAEHVFQFRAQVGIVGALLGGELELGFEPFAFQSFEEQVPDLFKLVVHVAAPLSVAVINARSRSKSRQEFLEKVQKTLT
jgi:hypothetical protein